MTHHIQDLINRRRCQVLIHGAIYYRLNQNIIDDYTYDLWSKELAELQSEHPKTAKECVYHKYFKDFDGSSGFDLPTHLPEVISKAYKLMDYHNKLNKEG